MSNICPKCKKEIGGLISVENAEITQRFCVIEHMGEISPEYEDVDRDFDGHPKYYCPECDEELFKDEDEAIEFLKNEDKLQKIVKEKIEKIKCSTR